MVHAKMSEQAPEVIEHNKVSEHVARLTDRLGELRRYL